MFASTHPILVAATLAASAPAAAQTFGDAVRANLALAVDLCVQHMGTERSLVGAYNAAGFTLTGQQRSGSTGTYRYAAPADTVSAELTSFSCDIATRHLGTGASVPLARDVLNGRLGGNFKEFAGSGTRTGPQEPCATFTFLGRGNLFLVMYAGSIAPPPGRACVEDETTRVWFEIPG